MQSTALAPGLLLAAPPLGDPNFSKTVVLLAMHSQEGSLGWVINGTKVAPVGSLLKKAGLVPEGIELPETPSYDRHARVGGPVSPLSVWALYRRDDRLDHPEQIVLDNEWAGTGNRTVVEAIARGEGPREFRLVLGYAGWAPQQLDEEIRAGAWLPVAFNAQIVFGQDDDALWERAYAKMVGISPLAFTAMRPGRA
ncbi:MAG TPA: YqgE/AlgH family protein [Polyangiaceae bacterium]|jgi:putative transcriptional regulator|nr:MAG: hypothetical protein BWY17_02935 [Deltaproteobacteria bacterium ADurb.Bin207]HNS98632.1 YqgE/AlgH family protein [Polyangiaceae bacterium]HNZ21635.1 YqgE/AlgH family protein [Polyangiaceae bacterium]HOD25067.1 YqgE/AlgH family protein [Polyangiaceae bacterium]HOE48592.1 YqgE/AlgH family protein [Polyangiaceae bacterium]